MSTTYSPTPSTPPSPSGRSSSSSRIRLLVLLGLLGVMLGALWYDYKVARPAVENAYSRIALLNTEINSRSGKQYMTNQDVQKELKRAPMETFTTDGGYMVEVYGWRSGLPTKTHKYYAVYTQDTPYIFLKHYMTEILMDELKNLPLVSESGPNVNKTDRVVDNETVLPVTGQKNGKRGGDGGGSESAPARDGSKANELTEKPSDVSATIADPASSAKAAATLDSTSKDKKQTDASSSEPLPKT